METSLMSESVVDAADVEETVTQVLTHFVCVEIETKRETAALRMLDNV